MLKGEAPNRRHRGAQFSTTKVYEFETEFEGPELPENSYPVEARVPIRNPILRNDGRTGFQIGGAAGQVVRRYPSRVSLR